MDKELRNVIWSTGLFDPAEIIKTFSSYFPVIAKINEDYKGDDNIQEVKKGTLLCFSCIAIQKRVVAYEKNKRSLSIPVDSPFYFEVKTSKGFTKPKRMHDILNSFPLPVILRFESSVAVDISISISGTAPLKAKELGEIVVKWVYEEKFLQGAYIEGDTNSYTNYIVMPCHLNVKMKVGKGISGHPTRYWEIFREGFSLHPSVYSHRVLQGSCHVFVFNGKTENEKQIYAHIQSSNYGLLRTRSVGANGGPLHLESHDSGYDDSYRDSDPSSRFSSGSQGSSSVSSHHSACSSQWSNDNGRYSSSLSASSDNGMNSQFNQSRHSASSEGVRHLDSSQTRHQDSSQSRHRDSSQGRHRDSSQGRHRDSSQGRHQDSSQGRHLDSSQRWRLDSSPSKYPESSQSRYLDSSHGIYQDDNQSFDLDSSLSNHPDTSLSNHPDASLSNHPDTSQDWHLDCSKSIHSDSNQSRNSDSSQGMTVWKGTELGSPITINVVVPSDDEDDEPDYENVPPPLPSRQNRKLSAGECCQNIDIDNEDMVLFVPAQSQRRNSAPSLADQHTLPDALFHSRESLPPPPAFCGVLSKSLPSLYDGDYVSSVCREEPNNIQLPQKLEKGKPKKKGFFLKWK